MFWLRIFFIFSPIVFVWSSVRPLAYTEKDSMISFAKHFIITRYLYLTKDLVRDATVKLRLAQRYVEMHKGSINYELGFIAAGVFEKFRFMMKVYRMYSDLDDFKKYNTTHLNTTYAFTIVRNTVNMYSRMSPGRPRPNIKRRNVMTTQALKRVRDDEYKKQLRMKKMEEKRANFDPELEGIEVDLESIV